MGGRLRGEQQFIEEIRESKGISRRTLIQRGLQLGLSMSAIGFLLTACSKPANTPAPSNTPTISTPGSTTATKAPAKLKYAYYATSNKDLPFWQNIVKTFNEKNPDIEVDVSVIVADSWGAYFDKLLTLVAGGNAPDVVRVAIEGTQLFGAKNLPLPLDDFIKKDSAELEEYFKDVHHKLIDVFKYEGKQIELPLEWNNMVCYFNTKMLADAGLKVPDKNWTIDQFVDYARKLTKGTVKGWAFKNAYFANFVPFIFMAGGNLLSADWKTSTANSQACTDALQLCVDLIHKEKVSPADASSTGFDWVGAFAQQQAAMIGGGRWPVLALEQAKFKDYNIQYLPKWKTQQTVFGVGGFPILKSTKYPNEAWRFLKYLTNKDLSTYLTSVGWGISARRSVAYGEAMHQLPPANYKIFYDSLDEAQPVPSPAKYNLVEQAMLREAGLALVGSKTAKAAMDEVHKQITDILKQPV